MSEMPPATVADSADSLDGGQILVAALRDQGVERVFCVPGESFLAVLDALHDVPQIAVVSARHEGAAANMAEADGKLTGRPGICFVTRGPGATHASVGVHTAFQDSTPMILFIGQTSRPTRDREGFQEVDFRAMFAPLAKWSAQIEQPERIPEYVARAYSVAVSGRPGPVVLSLPEDVLSARVPNPHSVARISAPRATAQPADLESVARLLKTAARPLIVLGGAGWTREGCSAIAQFAREQRVPLLVSFRRQDLIDNRDPIYCGHLGLGVDPALAQRVRSADLIIAIGTRLGENTTGAYTLFSCPVPQQQLVHVYPDPDELGHVYHPSLAIACGPSEFSQALAALRLPARPERDAWLQSSRSDYVRFSTPGPAPVRGVDLAAVVHWLSENLDDQAIIASGAGNYTIWVHRYFRYRQPRTELAPISGAMGYGLPAAIAAKLRHPERTVVAFAGDGCFLMYPQEIGTAAQHKANVVTIVVNNGIYGTIRMHQERRYPGRVVGTDILSPDMLTLARSFGAHAERIELAEQFPAAFERALAAGVPALLELRMDTAQITPAQRLKL